MAEVCDPESQLWISNLPITITVSVPSKVSIGRVRAFARATGDLTSLSEEDIEVIALALDLDVTAHGNDNHIRLEPSFRDPTALRVFTNEKHVASTAPLGSHGDNKQYRDRYGQQNQRARVGEVTQEMEQKYAAYKQSLFEDDVMQLLRDNRPALADQATANNVVGEENPNEWIDVALKPPKNFRGQEIGYTRPTILEARVQDAIIQGPTSQHGASVTAEDEGEGDWVTSETLMEDTLATLKETKDAVPVAICTADYSMQNVVMQMNLRLVSPQGVIKEIKRYAGKCSACLAISPILASPFCKKCGNKTMMKVAMYIKEDGTATFSTGVKHFNLHGTIFSLPAFASKKYLGRAGRRTIVPVASENDPNAKYILSLQGKSRNASSVTGAQHFMADIKGPASTKGSAITVPHFLKRNPNESKRGKKKYSHHL
ncbi:Nin one binding protein-like protein [Giardia lamblia P15]|uniref:Nin one binding protein-like protein n=1 Tax=Giardia intestinalis (strain P15) TaxID=658858 RepID=E1F1B0_GIAIA|nr:Nin one binding protein-like protein [Giardia lamblia P15]